MLILVSFIFVLSCTKEEPATKPELPVNKSSELTALTNEKSQEFNANPTEDCDKKPTPKPIDQPVDLTKKADEGCSLK